MNTNKVWKPIAVFALLCALLFAGCRSESEKFNPPESSYKTGFYTYSDGNATLKVKGAAVTPEFNSGDKIHPLVGRFFVKGDYAGEKHTAVIRKSFWVSHLGADATVIGKVVTVDGIQYTLVGIMSDSFNVPDGAQIWIPDEKS